MRWLLAKDLRILRRSPLLVAVLVLYPVVVSLLIGLALSKGPDTPKVAVLNEVPPSARTVQLGSQQIDTTKYAKRLFDAIDAVPVDTRAQAREKVKSGEVVAAIIIPADVTRRLESAVNLTGAPPPKIEVLYNASDPLKASYVESLIESRLADANRALANQLTKIAAQYLDILLRGGSFSLLGQRLEVLGLQRSKQVVDTTLRELPPSAAKQRRDLGRVSQFAGLAIANLNLSDQVLSTISEPLKVQRTVLDGRDTPLETFAVAIAAVVSLMLVTLLLAAGLLALERQEHTYARLVRGLVRPSGVLSEKALLAGACGFAVAFALLCGVGIFVPLPWSRLGLWVLALAAGAAAFGGLGVALGALAREVQAASLLAFVLALPLAFLAIVPESSVSSGLYDVIRVVSAAFPFKPALDALDAALSRGGLGVPVLHLLVLAGIYAVLARIAVRRLA